MKFLYGLYGANIPVIKEFDIEKNTKIEAGTVVRCFSDGSGISQSAIGCCIGVAAEDHSGEKDILNARSDGEKVRVDITGGGVYSVPAPRFTATVNGTATSFVCAKDGVNESIVGSKLMLVAKGENSSNTDLLGTMRKITEVTDGTDNVTIKLENGGVSCEGDVYALIPFFGYKGGIADDNKSFITDKLNGIILTVMGYDEKTASLEVLLGSKLFN